MDTLKLALGKQFLKRIKGAMNNGSFVLCENDKNQRMFVKLGFCSPIIKHVKAVIMNLNETHYHSGPENDDKGGNADIFIFKYNMEGEIIYIKLSYKVKNDQTIKIKCMSFHAWGEV